MGLIRLRTPSEYNGVAAGQVWEYSGNAMGQL